MRRVSFWIGRTFPFGDRGTLLQGCMLPPDPVGEVDWDDWDDRTKKFSWDEEDFLILTSTGSLRQRFRFCLCEVRRCPATHCATPPITTPTPFLITNDHRLRLAYEGEIGFQLRAESLVPTRIENRFVWPGEGQGWIGVLQQRLPGWFRRKPRWNLTAYVYRDDFRFEGPFAYSDATGNTLIGEITRVGPPW